MLKAERHTRIIELLATETFMSVTKLSQLIKVSDMTIRRDLQELESQKKLIRLYGGAQKLTIKDSEATTEEKIIRHIKEKEYIGQLMNTLINDNDVVYLGAGTTIFYALPAIKKRNLLIVTNSLITFNYLIKTTDYQILLTGGEFLPTTKEFIGSHAESLFTNLNIDISFAATNGIYNDNVTTATAHEGEIQRAAFRSSKQKVIVADSTKFNTSDTYTFCKLSELDFLITDDQMEENVFCHYSQFGHLIN